MIHEKTRIFPPSAIAVVRLHPDKSVLRNVLCTLAFTHPKGSKNTPFYQVGTPTSLIKLFKFNQSALWVDFAKQNLGKEIFRRRQKKK